MTHPDPQELLDRQGGTGLKYGNKEVVDFGENIGNYVDKDTGEKFSTSRGTIHYDTKNKAHIVPAKPKSVKSERKGKKVICVELFKQGLMEESVFLADEAFGEKLYMEDPRVIRGYHLWAKPVVILMRKSKFFTHLINLLAKPWSYEMAYTMGKRKKGNAVGKILMFVGIPFCGILGYLNETGQSKVVDHLTKNNFTN